MLRTNLDHLETEEVMNEALQTNGNVMICCGRMGPMCLPVYAIMDEVKTVHPHVRFFDQDVDGPAAATIQNLSNALAL